MENELVTRARVFATAAHAAIDQRRKYTNDPYIVHPAAVAALVENAGGTREMVAAAWLHDVIEDTKVSLELIEEQFGMTVAAYVGWLTDASKPADGNRAARKKIDMAHISRACSQAKTIKLADIIDNSRSIFEHDPKFAKVYLKEKRELLAVLADGNGELFKTAYVILERYQMEQPS